jgi:putative hemolysin
MRKFKFSYTEQASTPFKRWFILLVEALSGRAQLERLYVNIQHLPAPKPSFWAAAMTQLGLNIQFNHDKLMQAPKTGALIVIANHPYGVLDGLTAGYLVEKIRPDFKILASAVLAQVPEINPFLLAVDLSNRPEAQANNMATRRLTLEHLKNGGALIIFPAGLISTSPDRFGQQVATDPAWGTFTSKLIKRTLAHAPIKVLPIFFHGQNGRLFQIVSHISRTFRLALIFHEVKARIGTNVRVEIGDIIESEALVLMDNKNLIESLRQITYALKQD